MQVRFPWPDQPLPYGRGSVSRNRAATVWERLVVIPLIRTGVQSQVGDYRDTSVPRVETKYFASIFGRSHVGIDRGSRT